MSELWSHKIWPSLGNGSVNTFPRQPNHVTAARDTHATIDELLETVFSAGSVPRLSLIYIFYSPPFNTLGFSVFTSRILVTDFNTVIIPVSL
jgi:hypothetical protein